MQPAAVAVALPVSGQRVEHGARPAEERLSLAPIGTQVLKVLWRRTAAIGGVLLVQSKAGMTRGELP